MSTNDAADAGPDGCDCKVGRVIDEYDLAGVNRELRERRGGDGGDAASLRDLTDYFNKEVLRSAIRHAGRAPLDGEVENVYRLLTADEISSGSRTRARKRLEGDGVDLEAVERGFVSHPTIGSHLRNCLGVSRPAESPDRVATAEERIFKMQGRSEAVTLTTLERLADAGELVAGELTVLVDARVSCEDCGVHASVQEFIERGGCDCERG